MLFREREPETSTQRRFEAPGEEFAVSTAKGVTAIRVVGGGARVIEHMLALSTRMPEFVDVAVEDLRSGRVWRGEARRLEDARDALRRIAGALPMFGGVEFSLYTMEDQLTLTPYVELYIYSRTEHWTYLLEGRGVKEREALPLRSWRLPRGGFPEAPELVKAVAAAASALGLEAG